MFNLNFICNLHTNIFVKVNEQVQRFKLYGYDEEFFNSELGFHDLKPRRLLIKYEGRFREIDRTMEYVRQPGSKYRSVWLYKVI